MGQPDGNGPGYEHRPRQHDAGRILGDSSIEKVWPDIEHYVYTGRTARTKASNGFGPGLSGFVVTDADRRGRRWRGPALAFEYLGPVCDPATILSRSHDLWPENLPAQKAQAGIPGAGPVKDRELDQSPDQAKRIVGQL